MTFILIPNQGEDIQINSWNWRPTLELLLASGVITEDDHKRMGGQALGGKVDETKALLIAGVVMCKLQSMNPGERILANLSVLKEPKQLAVFTPDTNADDIDSNELGLTSELRLRIPPTAVGGSFGSFLHRTQKRPLESHQR